MSIYHSITYPCPKINAVFFYIYLYVKRDLRSLVQLCLGFIFCKPLDCPTDHCSCDEAFEVTIELPRNSLEPLLLTFLSEIMCKIYTCIYIYIYIYIFIYNIYIYILMSFVHKRYTAFNFCFLPFASLSKWVENCNLQQAISRYMTLALVLLHNPS